MSSPKRRFLVSKDPVKGVGDLRVPLFKMLLQKGSRENAIHALINTWLKDPTLSCAGCGKVYNGEACCDQPFIATNADILKQFTKELNVIRYTRANKHASTKDKSLRFAVSMPQGLMLFLTNSFKAMYNEDLFNKEYTVSWFMKRFGKYFGVPEEI